MIHSPAARRKFATVEVSNGDRAVHALLALVEARDPELMAHSMSVARVAGAVGAALGLPPREIAAVRRAGLIHDVGKLALSDAVLHKPGPLTEDEYGLVSEHAVLGWRMALALGLHREAAWVRHHHERPDGRGYPDGLAGRQIPLESEIIHVADAYDALVSDRPYRRALTKSDALLEIVSGTGWQFNRDCVSALVATTARG